MNCTEERDFHFSPLSLPFHFHLLLFFGILVIYLVSVSGNLLLIGLVYAVPLLHTPMYFFLCNLSVQDIVYVSATLPKFLSVTISGDSGIPFSDCMMQMFFFTFCVGAEFCLLAFMAYDRYVAICVPLCYTTIMNPNLCVALCSVAWLVGFCNSFAHAVILSNLFFCRSRVISHFYCDLKTMIELSSSDITKIQTMVSVECIFLGVIPFVLILSSYTCIIVTIVNIQSPAGRWKTFSSCSSHLIILILFYGPSLGSYLIPQSEHSKQQNKMLSLLYIALVPMLNPLVYSLRNKQVFRAVELLIERYRKY
ncbi:PREDICTED: olfactory receptor 2M2-like [Nanorana parkeri]|uniref:olfactory receptor 2M2-like n=1 Tax=Nanorana parkeri TaxID=125878 RepID=UPI000854D383|nr:PREDICTED: olfactory receptor 2M2-like [Nanorana parkeri]